MQDEITAGAVMLIDDGDSLHVRSTEDVTMEQLHMMLTTALAAVEQQMAGTVEQTLMVH